LIGGRRVEELQLPCFADWKTGGGIKHREGSSSETSGEIEWRAPAEQQWPIHTVENIRLRDKTNNENDRWVPSGDHGPTDGPYMMT
jgi:hypothetical protein